MDSTKKIKHFPPPLISSAGKRGQRSKHRLNLCASSCDNETKAQASLKDAELINQFKKIPVLPKEKKNLFLKMIIAYLRDFNTQQAYAS